MYKNNYSLTMMGSALIDPHFESNFQHELCSLVSLYCEDPSCKVTNVKIRARQEILKNFVRVLRMPPSCMSVALDVTNEVESVPRQVVALTDEVESAPPQKQESRTMFRLQVCIGKTRKLLKCFQYETWNNMK